MIEQAFLFHGSHGNQNEHWFPWLRDQLHHRSIEAFVPQFPILEEQSLESWMKTFAEFLPSLDDKTLFICHGTGGIFAMRVLEQASRSIHGLILVAPPATNAGGLPPDANTFVQSFVAPPFDWQRIRANAEHRVLLTSSSDPYVPVEANAALAQELHAKHIIFPNAGHLDESIGLTQFPALLAEIELMP